LTSASDTHTTSTANKNIRILLQVSGSRCQLQFCTTGRTAPVLTFAHQIEGSRRWRGLLPRRQLDSSAVARNGTARSPGERRVTARAPGERRATAQAPVERRTAARLGGRGGRGGSRRSAAGLGRARDADGIRRRLCGAAAVGRSGMLRA
jgi:hypothetical protein